MFTGTILAVLALKAAALPTLSMRQSDSGNPVSNVVEVNWDGQCFYPEPDDDFELEDYLGRWYQLAGTVAPFTAGCSCVYAEYSANTNGTVNVANGCQLGDQSITIQGTASVAPEVYGDEGVFTVQFPGQPAPECPGPNYIVQEHDDDFAIVQASNLTTLFLLSRQPIVEDNVIDLWLDRAAALGSDLTHVVRTNQTGCTYPTTK